MPIVSFKDEYFYELEDFYKREIGLSVELQRLKSLDEFIEEIAMYGLMKYKKQFYEEKNIG